MAPKQKPPNKYSDPFWVETAARAEKKHGIPSGLLQSILLNGEKTNADLVSEVGAKTPFQIIPSTRQAMLEKYGIDAYLNPDNAAEIASLHLKETLDRTKGNIGQAVAEYHAGPDQKLWGPKTKAYHDRVVTGLEQMQAQKLNAGAAKAYAAYSAGSMTPEQSSEFENLVNQGTLTLPEGAALKQGAQGPDVTLESVNIAPEDRLTAGTARAYQAYSEGTMTPEQTAEFERLVRAGTLSLPEGAALKEAPPETTLTGIGGAVTRGLGPVTAGATLGAGIGALAGGVGALPGALAGAGAVGLGQVIGDPLVSGINQLFGTNYQMPTEALEDLLTRVGVAEPRTAAERVVHTASRAVGETAGTAATGGLMAATPVLGAVARGTGQALAADLPAQLTGAALSGAAGQGAQELGAGPGTQLAASLLGGVTGAALGGGKIPMPSRQPTPRAAQALETVAAAEKSGVPVLTSDVLPPETFAGKTAQFLGERIPILGTGPVRKAQQTMRERAVTDFVEDFGVKLSDQAAEATDQALVSDLFKKRGDALTKYTGLKTEVKNKIRDAGSVPILKTEKAIDEQVKQLVSEKLPENQPIIEKLMGWRNAIQEQGIDNIEEIRKSMGTYFTAQELSNIRGKAEKSLSSIYPAIRDDIERFVETTAGKPDLNKWKIANKQLASLGEELSFRKLKSVLKTGKATPEDVNTLLFSLKPSEVRRLYNGLTDEGRAIAKTAIISKAAKDAVTDENVSVEKFINSVKKLGSSTGVFFKDEDAVRLKGLMRALNATRRASKAAAAPETGIQTFIPIASAAIGSVVGDLATTLEIAGGIGLAARAYESAPVRNMLLKMGSLKPGSKEEAALAKRILSTIQQQTKPEEEQQ